MFTVTVKLSTYTIEFKQQNDPGAVCVREFSNGQQINVYAITLENFQKELSEVIERNFANV